MAVDQQPILIAGPARSGTSMIANLFYRHGVWIGEAGKSKVLPIEENVGTENIHIKTILKDLLVTFGHIPKERLIPLSAVQKISPEFLKLQIEERVPEQDRWLIKTGLLLHFSEVFRKMYPEAYWIFPVRDKADILASVKNHPLMRRRKWDTGKLIDACHNRQALIIGITDIRAMMISPDRIIQNHEAAARLIRFCGLSFDRQAYERAIQRNRWKRWV